MMPGEIYIHTYMPGLENDVRKLGNLHQSTWKYQNCDFDSILLSKVENL